jgi:hypothetical protein
MERRGWANNEATVTGLRPSRMTFTSATMSGVQYDVTKSDQDMPFPRLPGDTNVIGTL